MHWQLLSSHEPFSQPRSGSRPWHTGDEVGAATGVDVGEKDGRLVGDADGLCLERMKRYEMR